MAFLMNCRTAWNDFYPSTSINNLNSQTYNSRQTPSGTGVYVSNCLFRSITSSGDGGALYITSVTYLLVESSSFFTCKTSSQCGGALYFVNSQSVLNKVCGFDCYSTFSYNPHYHFAWIQVNNAISNKNYVNYSSIVRCVSEESRAWYILCLFNGKACCPSVNMSLNKCYGRTIYCYPFTDSSSTICLFSYSSFTDNTLTGYTVFFLWRQGSKYEIKSCNILRNTQPLGNGEGIVYTYGNTVIEDSCILENKATYILYSESSYTTTLSNCTVDSTSKYGTVITQSTATKSFILALNHISTQNCHSKYDSAGTLTSIIQSPSSSKKRILLCTCGKFYNHSPIRDFVLLTCASLVLKLLPQ
jgi:hypothetical protein